MKLHLAKSVKTREGITLTSLACTNNPFIKGSVANIDRFNKEPEKYQCKKCRESSEYFKQSNT